jgi:hypothetical protein
MTHGTGVIVLLALAAGCCAAAEPHRPGAGDLEPKRFEFGGYVEAKLRHYQLNQDGAFYKVAFADQPQRSTLDRASALLKLTGSARADEWSFRFRTHSEVERDQIWHDSENRFDELVATWRPGPGFSLDAGKIVQRWGEGYTWNPVAFVERPKDPGDPRLPREGYTMLVANVRQDFPGELRTVTFTPLLLPVTEDVNSDFGRHDYLNVAGRLQFLFRESDVDFYFLGDGSRSGRVGMDFSHDLTDNLEIYGEWARIRAQDFRLTTPTGTSYARREAATSYLAGARYRTRPRTSFVFELQHNGTGLTTDEFQDFVELVDNAVQAGAGSTLMARAQALADSGYGRQKAMKDYLYVRASQGALPYTPSIRATVNLQDASYSIAPELLYSPSRRWGLRARFTLVGGGEGTEYGEKYYSSIFELRLHFHF